MTAMIIINQKYAVLMHFSIVINAATITTLLMGDKKKVSGFEMNGNLVTMVYV